MSFTPPSIENYQNLVHKEIDFFSKKVNLASTPDELQTLFNTVIEQLHASVDLWPPSIEIDVDQANEEREVKVNQLVSSILAEEKTEKPKDLKGIVNNVLDRSEYFTAVAGIWSEVEKKGIEPFIKEGWAFSELLYWIEEKNSWAIEQLDKLLDHNSPEGFRMLWIVGHENKHFLKKLTSLITEKKQALLTLQNFLAGDSEDIWDKTHAKGVMKTLYNYICKKESIAVYSILLKSIVFTSNRHRLGSFFMNLLLAGKNFPILFSILLNKIKVQDEWAIKLLDIWADDCETNFEEMKKSHFWAFLVTESYKDLDVQMILIASSKIQRGLVRFKSAVEDALMANPGNPKSLSSQLYSRLKFNLNKLESGLLELQLVFPYKFNWTTASCFYRYAIVYAHLDRIKRLICFLLKEGEPIAQDPPISDYFESPKVALVGTSRENLDVLVFLKKQFDKMNIPVMSVSSEDEAQSPDVEVLIGEQRSHQWIRDYVSIHLNSVRSPPFLKINKAMKLSAYNERLSRMKVEEGEDFKLRGPCLYGAITAQQGQVCFFDYCTSLFMQQNLPLKERLVQFLFCEGGNVLRGKKDGKGYILFGKDTLGLNRHPLQQLLAEIGLTKNETGKWVLEPPYEVEKATFQVSDEDMIRLLEQDWGVDEAHAVEQPEYHLDVSMAFADSENKIVLLNDSLKCAQILERHYTLEILESGMDKKKADEVKGKIKSFKLESQKRAFFEKKTKKDLEEAGFTVCSVPGQFEELSQDSPLEHQVNFFNHISCLNEKGEKCIFALGAPPFFEKLCEKTLKDNIPNLKHIYFAPIKGSQSCLKKGGGLHCITQLVH